MTTHLARRLGTASGVVLFSCAAAVAQQLAPREIVSGLQFPVAVASASDDPTRLYVVERGGRVRVVKDGVLQPAPLLDLSSDVSTDGDGGLLGLAFHPGFAQNRRLFVSFSDLAGDAVVREYEAAATPDSLVPDGEKTVFGPYQAGPNHYGLDLQFGPDAKLYLSLGANTASHAQSLSSYQGKILRLDVDRPFPHVPIDNPYADPQDGARDLIWARGLRCPWRMSFDRVKGDLWFGDVGDQRREEINHQLESVGRPGHPRYRGGLDYGWPCMEGSSAVAPCPGGDLTAPVFELGPSAKAIVAGRVYRGNAVPELRGRYVCADWGTSEFWSFALVGGVVTDVRDHTGELSVAPGQGVAHPVAFGEDAHGELYVLSYFDGKLWRIERACRWPVTTCEPATNSTGLGAAIGWSGTTSASAGDLVLRVTDVPPGKAGFFFHGAHAVQLPIGNGLRCVGGDLVRLGVVVAGANGVVVQAFDAGQHGLDAGTIRHFQLYYRDPAAGGAQFNYSDGLRVTFCP